MENIGSNYWLERLFQLALEMNLEHCWPWNTRVCINTLRLMENQLEKNKAEKSLDGRAEWKIPVTIRFEHFYQKMK